MSYSDLRTTTWVFISVVFSALIFLAYIYPPFLDSWGYASRNLGPVGAIKLQWTRYFVSNPRIGELALMVGAGTPMKRAAVNGLGIALLFTSLGWLVFQKGSNHSRLAVTFSILIAFAIIVYLMPSPGVGFLYIPHNANYVFGFGLTAFFFAFHMWSIERTDFNLAIPLALIIVGLIAGLANEHTAPAVLFALVCCAGWRFFETRRINILEIASITSYLIGFLALVMAPGQSRRYGNLAEKSTINVDVIFKRIDTSINLLFYNKYLTAICIFVPVAWTVYVVLKRRSLQRTSAIASGMVITSLIMAVTVLASPIIVPRMFVATHALLAFALALTVWDLFKDRVILLSAISFLSFGAASIYLLGAAIDVMEMRRNYENRSEIAQIQKSKGCVDLVFPVYKISGSRRNQLIELPRHDKDTGLNRSIARYFGAASASIIETDHGMTVPKCEIAK